MSGSEIISGLLDGSSEAWALREHARLHWGGDLDCALSDAYEGAVRACGRSWVDRLCDRYDAAREAALTPEERAARDARDAANALAARVRSAVDAAIKRAPLCHHLTQNGRWVGDMGGGGYGMNDDECSDGGGSWTQEQADWLSAAYAAPSIEAALEICDRKEAAIKNAAFRRILRESRYFMREIRERLGWRKEKEGFTEPEINRVATACERALKLAAAREQAVRDESARIEGKKRRAERAAFMAKREAEKLLARARVATERSTPSGGGRQPAVEPAGQWSFGNPFATL